MIDTHQPQLQSPPLTTDLSTDEQYEDAVEDLEELFGQPLSSSPRRGGSTQSNPPSSPQRSGSDRHRRNNFTLDLVDDDPVAGVSDDFSGQIHFSGVSPRRREEEESPETESSLRYLSDPNCSASSFSIPPGLTPATPQTAYAGGETREELKHWSPSAPLAAPSGPMPRSPSPKRPPPAAPELERSDPSPPPSREAVDPDRNGEVDLSWTSHEIQSREIEREMEQKYTEEVEELLRQLEGVEVEYESRIAELEAVVRSRDAAVDALGSHLTDVSRRSDALVQQLEQREKAERKLREEMTLGNGVIRELREELDQVMAKHEHVMREEEGRWEREVSAAEHSIKAAAERQFAEANGCYLKLREEHDKVEAELKKVRLEAGEGERRIKSREAYLLAEFAEMRSELASAQAEAAFERKRRSKEAEASERRQSDLEAALSSAREESTALSRSFASIVTEREKLSSDNRELQGVCEELMAIVEGDKDIL